jgi:hypothetical protein
MGAGVTKKQNEVVSNNYKSIKYGNVINYNGNMYCEVSRKDFKLTHDILGIIGSRNNFSSDHEEGLNIVKTIHVYRK